jgi:ankyrin repeat protein
MATVLRETSDHVQRKPTAEESNRLRNAIRICRYFTSEFDLTDNLFGEDEVWGTASLINLAVELDDISLLDQLVSEGHSKDGLPNSLGISTLYIATYRQMANAFHWSLQQGVDPNLTDVDGVTPLMLAAMNPQDQLASIAILLDAGARIDMMDSDGRPALVYAIRRQQYDNARLLADAGADVAAARQGLILELENANTDYGADRIQEAIDFLDQYLATETTD